MSAELKKLLAESRKALAKKNQAKAAAAVKGKKSFAKGGKPEGLVKNLRQWGVKSLDELTKVNTSEKKYAYLGESEIAKVKQLKEDVDTCIMIEKMFGTPVKDQKFFKEELSFTLKAFGITTGDEGFEWIPTMVSDSFIDEFNLARKVSGLFMEVKMPSNPYKWPVLTNGAIARRVAQATAGSRQTFDTDNTIQFDAIKLTGRYELPEELSEDSAPDVVKVIRTELMEGQEKAMEIAILEGDTRTTGAIHHFTQLPDEASTTLITAVTGTPERIFDGIRARLIRATVAVTGVNSGGNAVSETELSRARGIMGKFGVDPSQLAIIVGPKVYNQMLNLDDVRTLDLYGAKATVLSGELAKYEGIPVIVSEYLREDLGAAGVNTATAADNTLGSVIFVNRKRWFTGLRRATQYRIERNKTEFDVLDMVSFSRKAFQATLKADGTNYADESIGSMVYNIGSL